MTSFCVVSGSLDDANADCTFLLAGERMKILGYLPILGRIFSLDLGCLGWRKKWLEFHVESRVKIGKTTIVGTWKHG